MNHRTTEPASKVIGHSAAEDALPEFCCSKCGLKHSWIFYQSMCCGARVVAIEPSKDSKIT